MRQPEGAQAPLPNSTTKFLRRGGGGRGGVATLRHGARGECAWAVRPHGAKPPRPPPTRSLSQQTGDTQRPPGRARSARRGGGPGASDGDGGDRGKNNKRPKGAPKASKVRDIAIRGHAKGAAARQPIAGTILIARTRPRGLDTPGGAVASAGGGKSRGGNALPTPGRPPNDKSGAPSV
jgi:hypothetical protein